MVYTFRCPVCAKFFRSEEPGEPCCTGPSETLDEHELAVMHLYSIERRAIAPDKAAARASGPLIVGALCR